jgi:hypothetical protein
LSASPVALVVVVLVLVLVVVLDFPMIPFEDDGEDD